MDDTSHRPSSTSWRISVWGLRLAGLGLAVVLCGFVTRLWSDGIGLSILAAGMVVYLVGAVTVFSAFLPAIRALSTPRPSFWALRRKLVHDALHAVPSRAHPEGA
jgi:predicted membrane channel-forming protein YqfA (hemolysin III family)